MPRVHHQLELDEAEVGESFQTILGRVADRVGIGVAAKERRVAAHPLFLWLASRTATMSRQLIFGSKPSWSRAREPSRMAAVGFLLKYPASRTGGSSPYRSCRSSSVGRVFSPSAAVA